MAPSTLGDLFTFTSTLSLILLHCAIATAAQCNTDQNPTCAGVAAFEALCCNYPSVCYWKDKYATPGCCAAGQVCLTGDGTTIIPNQVQSHPYTTITSTYPITSVVPVTSTVTTQNPVVTVTSATNVVTPAVVVTSTVSQAPQTVVNTANAVIATGSQAWVLRPSLTTMCVVAAAVVFLGL